MGISVQALGEAVATIGLGLIYGTLAYLFIGWVMDRADRLR